MNIKKQLKQQRGMSLIGFLIVLSMVVFFAYLAMRITPIYIEFYSVKQAMNGVADEPGSANFSPFDVKDKMLNRLYVSYSDGNVTRENIKVVRNNGVWLVVRYDVRKPLMGNLDIIASFDERVMLGN
ncbi:MAG: DUF4845 domain-containing protein [Xanthomonadales bacterium]|jgi:hypothetical protein|nr:DUF4845 domain-containing protein [Xanthomonadales bacterium]